MCECVISSSIKSRQFITKRGGGVGGGGGGGYDVDTMLVCVCGCEKEVLQDKKEREEVKINQHHIMQRMYTKKWCGLREEEEWHDQKNPEKGQTEEEDEDEKDEA